MTISQNAVRRGLRGALALPGNTIRYGPVELVEGSDAAAAADYRTRHVLVEADPIDPVRSEGAYVDRDGPGSLLFRRDGFRPSAPLFGCDPLRLPVVTDAFAERVMRDGPDVAFVDVAGQASRTEAVMRRRSSGPPR